MSEQLDLLLKYPLISSQVRNGRHYYTGIVRVADKDYTLEIIEKESQTTPKFHLKTDLGAEIQKIVKRQSNIIDVLDAITAALDSDKIASPIQNYADAYRRVLFEYTEFTRFHLNMKSCSLTPDLSQIKICTVDEKRREHHLEISVDFNENRDMFRPINVDLPFNEFDRNWDSLTEVFDRFLANLERFQGFFDLMDEIDEYCCVIDPEKPTRGCCYRRIWLDENFSVMVTVDPVNVKARPDLKFLGPERLVQRYRDKLNNKLEEWEEERNVLEGILEILELQRFPAKPEGSTVLLTNTGECSICFSLRLNQKLPEIICSNKCCENFYHIECLYEWLTAVNSKEVFNQISGQCPNCEKEIICPLPEAAL